MRERESEREIATVKAIQVELDFMKCCQCIKQSQAPKKVSDFHAFFIKNKLVFLKLQ